MRILMVTERYLPIWGGAENQLRQLMPHLRAKGCAVEVVTRRWHASMPCRETMDGVMVRRLGVPGTGAWRTLLFTLHLFCFLLRNKDNFDLYHSHGAVNMGVLCRLAGFFTDRANIVKIASAGRILHLQHTGFGRILLAIFKKSHAIVCMSDEIQEELETIGTPAAGIFRTTNAVDCERFQPLATEAKKDLRARLGLDPAVPVVLFSSRLVFGKGLDVLLAAWPEIANRHPEARLVIVGSGRNQNDSVEEDMRALVATRGLDSVVFAGETDTPEQFLGMADIFAFPSRREGFPNALMEALATGIPVVASKIGGVVELVEHGETGFLFAAEDHEQLARLVIELLDNPESGRVAGARARERMAKKYSFASVAADYVALYENTLAQNRSVCPARSS